MRQAAKLLICCTLALTACAAESGFEADPATYSEFSARIGDAGGTVVAARVNESFFGRALPIVGRLFADADYTADGNPPTALVSHTYWQEALDARPEVVGSTIVVDGVERMIVGVMPAGVDVPEGVALWLPRVGGP